MSERDDMIEQAYHAPQLVDTMSAEERRMVSSYESLKPAKPSFADYLLAHTQGEHSEPVINCPACRVAAGATTVEESEGMLERFGGDDYNPEGSGWFKPWATCPSCGKLIIAWTDKALLEKIQDHCAEVGCAPPEL